MTNKLGGQGDGSLGDKGAVFAPLFCHSSTKSLLLKEKPWWNFYLQSLDYGNGNSVDYTYDSRGRLTSQTYEDGDTVTYQYDNDGALAVVTDSATGITTRYYYDFTGRTMKYTESASGYSHSVGYDYDDINNLISQVETINGTTHTTSYTYDKDNRVKSKTTDGITVSYTYDALGRITQQVTTNGTATILTESYTYTANSSQIATYCTESSGYDVTYTYIYDDNGNILSVSDGTNTTSYVYDSQNQLLRENNQAGGFTHVWAYDNAGNIQSRAEYEYSASTLGAHRYTLDYTYGDSEWGDLLTAYDGDLIWYDALGNRIGDCDWLYTWEHGRELTSIYDANVTWSFTYDANGMRTKRTDGTSTYSYVYNGDKLVRLIVDAQEYFDFYFTYDANGTPLTMTENGMTYYYVTNLQGDVIGIIDSSGEQIVTYTYDAWGNILTHTNTQLADYNPLRYRGYVYDQEMGLYYLQSRYYDPEIGRFINADAFVATGQGFVGNNMFAYCLNNPVNFVDAFGTNTETLQWWSSGMAWICAVDSAFPVGDIIYVGGIIVLGGIALFSLDDVAKEISFDEATTTYASPSPQKQDDDDDDLDDDYYDDDSNFGGKQKVGKQKGNTPGNNKAQNKQFRDATKGLDPSHKRLIHDAITGKGYGYQDIIDIRDIFLSLLFTYLASED